MNRSWDENMMDWQESCSHDDWKERLFTKVIRARRLDYDRDAADYELKQTVVPDEAADL